MDPLIIAVAQYALYAVALAGVLVWLKADRRDKLGLVVSGVVMLVALGLAIKGSAAAWADPRPFVVDHHAPLFPHQADNGFPSDHTAVTAAVSFLVMWWRRIVGVAMLVLSVAIGAARVAAHVHHVPDILGGVGVGLLSAAVGVLVWRLLAPRLTAARWGREVSDRGAATPEGATPPPR